MSARLFTSRTITPTLIVRQNMLLQIRTLLTVLAVSIPMVIRADDNLPASNDPNPVEVESKDNQTRLDPDKKPEPAPEPSLLDKLSKELFKELDTNPAGTEKPAPERKEDKFDQVARGMRSAGNKLEEKQTDEETTKIQEQVIRDLDDLIKQLQNPPPSGGGGGGGGGSNSSGSGGATNSRGGGRQRMAQQGGKGLPQGGTTRPQSQGREQEQRGQDRKDAQGSDERTDSERKAAEEAARKQKLEIDVWGHLPPHLRDQLLNTYGERILPKYEQLVKQFYEALSEQSDTKPRR